MAKSNTEIEIKLPVDKKTFYKLRLYLRKNAKYISSSREIDRYYNAPHRDFLEPKTPVEYLRVRTKANNSSFTYKHIYLDSNGHKTHADEYELRISDPRQLEKILSTLDFENFLTIDKKRESYKYKNLFEIDLDEVQELGFFVEIEALKDFGSKEDALENVTRFASQLGLDTEKQDRDGYVLLMMKKTGLAKI